ncbi:tumor susceptibility protein [Coccomyxa subellipsoidea C-169]|uniref:Tumor susceptibility protein n=1 Tax=Coccomyxa subellipsoidea (strain C-169) TaxID=574566 RepID=I0Z3J2_COCSC|nr:tumor susceptibility protein [Coccomyxa subellipsoidea C-169]EIE25211.1 tumor susceptibility protein [Coccomyxa subellipsoidea C-169]|eukprot:XP_005649755.1 tumor susceptibility protein [Coccomyxa subellipsoidea C-169]
MGPLSSQLGPESWLRQVLGDQGQTRLPYNNDAKFAVRQHLLDLVSEFPTLVLKQQQYTHTNGSTVQLLMADGTLPMYYQGVKYNIPVSIWLPEAYPRQQPIMYVVPTSDMIIKPQHSFVDPSGMVFSPYLRNWIYGRSNLVDMAQDTSMQFGHDPPLFSKPPNWAPPAQPSSTSQHPDTFLAHNPIHRRSCSNVRPTSLPTSAKLGVKNNLQELFRKSAIAELTKRLQGSLARANDAATADMDKLFEQQAELTRRERDITRGVESIQAERHALEGCVLEMSGKAAALGKWLVENEKKLVSGEVDADTAILPADVLSKQALEGQAEDLALEDTLYSLDKALQNNSLTPELYIKQVRALCGKQFMVRALGRKVANRQDQLRRAYHNAPTAAGSLRRDSVPGPSHVQMPQGDSWTSVGILSNPLTQGR